LKEVDDLMPGKYYVKFFLGSCHLAMNRLPEALACFDEALSLDPKREDVASIYSYMGICLKDQGEYRKAIAVLEKAEKSDNERTDVYNLMGFCHFKLKEHEKAIECFQRVLSLDPGSAIDYANIASNYRDIGNKQEAIRYYKVALELDPSIEFARDNLERLQE
jgi:ribosomal protein S12 methylthiotransferase accessory factor